MPDKRGSAAKTELCVRALANAHGVELPPFGRGVIPDLEAFVRSRTEFVASYAAMFDTATRNAGINGGMEDGPRQTFSADE